MNNNFSGKTVLVSGGSSGIGQRICIDFARRGADIAFLYKSNDEGADDTYQQAKALGVNCYKYKASVCKSDEIKEVVSELISSSGRIDVLVNCAGILKVGPLAGMHYDDWYSMIDTNLNGVFRLTKCCFPYLLKSKGMIINISSYMAFKPNGGGQAVYSASKAALIGLTRELANELGKTGIRVNTIAPGLIETEMIKKLPEKTVESLKSSNTIRKIGQVEDISAMSCYLASEDAGYITGQTFIIDGGSGKGLF